MATGPSALMLAASLTLAACAATPPTPTEVQQADYGAQPVHYREAIAAYLREQLKDPLSVQYGEISAPEKGFFSTKMGLAYGGRTKRAYGWLVNASINAKNSYGGYVGFKTYQFLFRGEDIVAAIPPE
jgi:hypothetical protein